MDRVKAKKQQLQAQSGRREKTFKPQPGKSRLRILPPWRGGDDTEFFHDFGQHFIKDKSDKLQAVYMCTEKTSGKPCVVCNAIAQGITESDDDEVINALNDSKSKGRVLLNALHLDGDDPETPVILDLTPTTFEKVLEVMDEYGDITDIENGCDIVINRTGKGLNTEYSVMPSPKSNPVNKAVLAKMHDLSKYVEQEFAEGENKALTAVGVTSGSVALPAPAAKLSGDTPSTSVEDMGLDDDIDPADDGVIEGVSEVVEATAEEAVATGATKAEVEGIDADLSEDDLDAMLAELE